MSPVASSKKSREFDPITFLATIGEGRKSLTVAKRQGIFTQGDAADAVFYIQKGQVRLTVVSKTGKEATIGILDAGNFFGEGALAGQSVRMGSATAMTRVPASAHRQEGHDGCASSGARVFRFVRLVSAGAQHPLRRGPGRPVVQFQRKATGPCPAVCSLISARKACPKR